MDNSSKIKEVIIGLAKQEPIISAELKKEMSLSDETQFQTDNLSRILKLSCPTLIGHLSRSLKLSCPTWIGHLSRINKEVAKIFGSKLSFCPKMTEKGLCPSMRRSAATVAKNKARHCEESRMLDVAISLNKCLMNIKNHYCKNYLLSEIATSAFRLLGMTFSTLTLASVFQRHSEPQAKNPEKIILDNWILRFAPAPLRMTASVLAFLFSLNLSTAWAGEHVCIGSTGKWKDTGQSCTTCGTDCNWELVPVVDSNNQPVYISGTTKQAQTLNITGSSAMTNFDEYYKVPWFSSRDYITSANITGVTSVGTYALGYASNLTSVNMPNVTEIKQEAFKTTSSLTSVNMPNVETIGGRAFTGASALTTIDMPNVETIGGQAFQDATSLTSVDMPNVTTIEGYAFDGATSLTSVDMPNVTTIGRGAFEDASSLTSVDMPNVTTIVGGAFSRATNLSYVGLPTAKDGDGCLLGTNGEKLTTATSNCIIAVSIDDSAFLHTGGVENCPRNPSACGTCTGYLVSGRGCVTADTCEDLAHYKWDSNTNSCNRIQTAQNNQQGTGSGTGTGTASDTGTGTTTAASCTNGASIGGECFPKRYTPAEIAELVGESNTILLYYK